MMYYLPYVWILLAPPSSKRTQDETVTEKCVINSLKNVTKLLTVEITSVAKVKGD